MGALITGVSPRRPQGWQQVNVDQFTYTFTYVNKLLCITYVLILTKPSFAKQNQVVI